MWPPQTCSHRGPGWEDRCRKAGTAWSPGRRAGSSVLPRALPPLLCDGRHALPTWGPSGLISDLWKLAEVPGETFQKLLRAQSRRRDWEGGAGVGRRASHSDNPGLESPESPGLTPVLRPAHLLWLCIRPVHGPTIHARLAPHLEPSRSEDGVGCPVSLTQRVRLQGLLASLEAQGPWEALGEVSAGWMVAPVFLWKERLSSLAHSGQWAALGPRLGAREASRVWTLKQGAPRPTEEVLPLVLEAAPLGGGQVSSHQTWLSIFLLVYAPVPASSPRNQVWLLSGTQRAWLGLAGFSIPWGSRRPGAAPSDGWPGPWGA